MGAKAEAQALPDITITQATVPSSGNTAAVGASFQAAYTLTNTSTVNILTDFQLGYYYCPAISLQDCVALGKITVTQDLIAGGNYLITSGNLTVPNVALYGTGYLLIYLDETNVISESNENNNQVFFAITVTTLPDLSFSSAKVPLTGNTTPGSTFTAELVLTNAANSSAFNNKIVVQHYYCPTKSPTGCTLLLEGDIYGLFKSGESLTIKTNPLTVPVSATPNSGYLRTIADATQILAESNESNNERYDPLFAVPDNPDLSITAAVVPYSGGVSQAGSSFTVQYTINNAANVSSFTTDFYLTYYYCPTQTTTNCIELGQDLVIQDFSGGASYAHNSRLLTLPTTGINVGTGYIRVFVDSTNLIEESNESNNNRYDVINITNINPIVDSGLTPQPDARVPDSAASPQQDATIEKMDAMSDQSITPLPDPDSGCGCHTAPHSRAGATGGILLLLAFLISSPWFRRKS